MRKLKTAIAVLFIIALCTASYAAEPTKLGIVNLQKALNTSIAGNHSKIELEAFVKLRQAEIEKIIAKKEKLQGEFEVQRLTLSEEAISARLSEMSKLEKNAERLIQDSNDELQKLQRSKEMTILKELTAVIKAISKQYDYALILPSDTVIYYHNSIDVTDLVISKYNETKQPKATK